MRLFPKLYNVVVNYFSVLSFLLIIKLRCMFEAIVEKWKKIIDILLKLRLCRYLNLAIAYRKIETCFVLDAHVETLTLIGNLAFSQPKSMCASFTRSQRNPTRPSFITGRFQFFQTN